MKRLQPLLFGASLMFLAACSQDTQPTAATPGFNFSVDPGAGSVAVTSSGAAALRTLQLGECGSEDPRVLFAEDELALETFEFVFLPGNILEITASFTNVTDFTFEQPFTFSQADSTSNIVSSDEPEVTDADLGGDGELAPGETTSVLNFTVEHMGQPFDYEVLAEAVVVCPDDNGEDPDPDEEADLAVTKDGDAMAEFDDEGNATVEYTVNVTNIGTADAEDVTLTDTFTIDLSDFDGVSAVLTAQFFPVACTLDDEPEDEVLVLTCDLGDLEVENEDGEPDDVELAFAFNVALEGNLEAIDGPITLTNTAVADTTSEESELDNNTAVLETILTAEEADEPELANLTVSKDGQNTATLDDEGSVTLTYTVTVDNEGNAAAEGVVLTDTLIVLDLAELGDATITVDADLDVEDCILEAEAAVEETLAVFTCTFDTIEADGEEFRTFTFTLTFDDLPADLETIEVQNTAEVTTTSEESDDTDNEDAVDTVITVGAANGGAENGETIDLASGS